MSTFKSIDTPKLINNNTIITPSRKSPVYTQSFSMAFVTADNRQVHSSVSCRDYLQDILRVFYNDNKRLKDDGHPYYPNLHNDPPPCIDRLRLLLTVHKSDAESSVIHALKMLNAIERYADIELTILEKVHVDKINAPNFLLRGSGEYMANPHLLSLVTLVMRFCTCNQKFEVRNEQSLAKGFSAINIVKDKFLMRDSRFLIPEILKRRKKLFAGLTITDLFPTSLKYKFHDKGGIHALCLLNSPNKIVNNRLAEFKDEVIKKYKE